MRTRRQCFPCLVLPFVWGCAQSPPPAQAPSVSEAAGPASGASAPAKGAQPGAPDLGYAFGDMRRLRSLDESLVARGLLAGVTPAVLRSLYDKVWAAGTAWWDVYWLEYQRQAKERAFKGTWVSFIMDPGMALLPFGKSLQDLANDPKDGVQSAHKELEKVVCEAEKSCGQAGGAVEVAVVLLAVAEKVWSWLAARASGQAAALDAYLSSVNSAIDASKWQHWDKLPKGGPATPPKAPGG